MTGEVERRQVILATTWQVILIVAGGIRLDVMIFVEKKKLIFLKGEFHCGFSLLDVYRIYQSCYYEGFPI